MFQLKPIRPEAAPEALEKALRYRLLNEPLEAESICRDVLELEPDNQEAIVTLLLALTDQFGRGYGAARDDALAVWSRLTGEYEQAYYEGLIEERWAKSQLGRGMPHSTVADWMRRAMRCYEKAEALSPPDNPDAILRWNTCARFIDSHSPPHDVGEESLSRDIDSYDDEAPVR